MSGKSNFQQTVKYMTYLEAVRWKMGFNSHIFGMLVATLLLQALVMAGTRFYAAKLPLTKWSRSSGSIP